MAVSMDGFSAGPEEVSSSSFLWGIPTKQLEAYELAICFTVLPFLEAEAPLSILASGPVLRPLAPQPLLYPEVSCPMFLDSLGSKAPERVSCRGQA